MAIQLNHTIVFSHDKKVSADFLCEILGRPAAVPFGPFLGVRLDNGVTLDFMNAEGDVALQHYAFLVSDAEFDQSFARIRERNLMYWADPYRRRPEQVSTDDGGRRIYFEDPSKHFLEIFTKE
ncbi:VOC family protein [Cupriavidus sp. AcVe19-6a]|uniref:VOC family protein n=1 Tax=Cupriavidus sp. AcVe19-6a TaxID=2821358 RepID=UPI001AE177FF|nr:VOC family protein [Cupriavidus sp. AcVe19-6a]MBP0634623.1 VOC family protein [Cupriavidus sp. AcVe19-6a]